MTTASGVLLRWVCLVAVVAVMSAGVAAQPAWAVGAGQPSEATAAQDAERALAERFAPVVRLVRQDVPCGPGEPFRPSDVEIILDDPSVALIGPWGSDGDLRVGPTATDLGEGLFGYHLDMPGNPLEPGCDYEEWVRGIETTLPPTTYAHVVTEDGVPDRLALQYWLFYPFNDYTNKHEGDWEMIQLVFAADTAAEALGQNPLEVGYSQHEGLEVAQWDDPKLQVEDTDHPVVYPAAGSHANFFESALFLGTSAEQGFGCDDTRGPSDDIRPTVAVIPSDPAAARADFPWIGYQGRWGQREQSFYNGPTGPNMKESWTQAITYQDENGRDVSYAVPAGGLLGTSATDFFCSTVSGGSELVRKLADAPGRLLIILSLFALLVVWLLRRTTWTPAAPLRIARRRAVGQTIRASARMYASRWRLFIGIGFLLVPASLVVAGLQSLIVAGPEAAGLERGGEDGGLRIAAAAVSGYLVLGVSILLVLSATTCALDAIDRGEAVGVRSAYGQALARWKPLLGALLSASVLVGGLALTVILLPVAAVLVLLFALFVPVIVFEGAGALASLRRSAVLVRGRVVRTAVLLGASIFLSAAGGPFVGAIVILVTGAPLAFANIVAGVVYACLMPFVGLTMAYLYFDARVRAERADADDRPTVLPAEI
ncbi:hypothetical protein GA707_08770 [Nostocoides sp. F2B08]|uniref:hypothetical protein n=1 Tax=Nostocoides sp. F2B08 TaxID=2653936 RepID=UPI001262FDB4|nr:hypothetical protein [Tetrasphaera sp. F2B08]KAB7744675.1 hypothetical protein GA707_08770 [Tetrasphaera sp. F2B08]